MRMNAIAINVACALVLSSCDKADTEVLGERLARVFNENSADQVGDANDDWGSDGEASSIAPLPPASEKAEAIRLFEYGSKLDFDLTSPEERAEYEVLRAYLKAPPGSRAESRAWSAYARIGMPPQAPRQSKSRSTNIGAEPPKAASDERVAIPQNCSGPDDPVSGTVSLESEFSTPSAPYIVLTTPRPYCLLNPWTGETSTGRRIWLGFLDGPQLPTDISAQLGAAVGSVITIEGELTSTGNASVTQCCEFQSEVAAISPG